MAGSVGIMELFFVVQFVLDYTPEMEGWISKYKREQ